MKLLPSLFALALGSSVALGAGSQRPFGSQPNIDVSKSLLEAQVVHGIGNDSLHLSNLASDGFTALYHDEHPAHRIRVKKSNFCDPTVNVYTGYLDVDDGAKHLFFYFFESRRNPDKDDVIMWINGGPGCSSSTGLLFELGPCNIDTNNASPNGTTWNPYSWNSEANIFFLDQPVGVGFSYAEHGETVGTTEEAARNVQAFVTIFFSAFPQFSGRPFHLAGESYGGRYLPVFAGEIVDKNAVAAAQNRSGDVVNLKSVMIGNGNTDPAAIFAGRYEIECGKAAFDTPFQSISACVQMKRALPRCQDSMRRHCVETIDEMNCRAAVAFCQATTGAAFYATGRNVYDVSKPCEGDLCYKETGMISKFLDRPEVRKELGVTLKSNFTSCSEEVGALFNSHLDKFGHPTQYYITGLLERGVRVLIYAGTYDWQCNWVSNRIMVDSLDWSGAEEFKAAEYRDWFLSKGEPKAGETRSYGPLTFATVRGAGHMVPHDKPAESLAMVSRWIAGEAL